MVKVETSQICLQNSFLAFLWHKPLLASPDPPCQEAASQLVRPHGCVSCSKLHPQQSTPLTSSEACSASSIIVWLQVGLPFSSFQFSHSVLSDSLQPHGLQHARPPCPSPTPRVYSDSCPLSWWCHPTTSSTVIPFFSSLQSSPASGSLPMSQFFISGGHSIGISASASVLPMNIQDWFPLGWTGWISLLSKGLWRDFSNTVVRKHKECLFSLWRGNSGPDMPVNVQLIRSSQDRSPQFVLWVQCPSCCISRCPWTTLLHSADKRFI